MRRISITTLTLGMLLCVPIALAEDAPAEEAAPDAASVTKAIMEQWSKVNSMTATLDFSATFALSPQAQPGEFVGGGSLDYLKREGKPLSRLDVYVRPAQSQSGMNLAEALVVYDGVEAGAEVKFLGNAQYHSLDAGSFPEVSDQLILDLLSQHFDLDVEDDAEVDGVPVYVLGGSPTFDIPENVPVNTLRACFSKETGVPLKLEVFDDADQPIATLYLKEISLNADIGEDRFVIPQPPPEPETTDESASDDTDEEEESE